MEINNTVGSIVKHLLDKFLQFIKDQYYEVILEDFDGEYIKMKYKSSQDTSEVSKKALIRIQINFGSIVNKDDNTSLFTKDDLNHQFYYLLETKEMKHVQFWNGIRVHDMKHLFQPISKYESLFTQKEETELRIDHIVKSKKESNETELFFFTLNMNDADEDDDEDDEEQPEQEGEREGPLSVSVFENVRSSSSSCCSSPRKRSFSNISVPTMFADTENGTNNTTNNTTKYRDPTKLLGEQERTNTYNKISKKELRDNCLVQMKHYIHCAKCTYDIEFDCCMYRVPEHKIKGNTHRGPFDENDEIQTTIIHSNKKVSMVEFADSGISHSLVTKQSQTVFHKQLAPATGSASKTNTLLKQYNLINYHASINIGAILVHGILEQRKFNFMDRFERIIRRGIPEKSYDLLNDINMTQRYFRGHSFDQITLSKFFKPASRTHVEYVQQFENNNPDLWVNLTASADDTLQWTVFRQERGEISKRMKDNNLIIYKLNSPSHASCKCIGCIYQNRETNMYQLVVRFLHHDTTLIVYEECSSSASSSFVSFCEAFSKKCMILNFMLLYPQYDQLHYWGYAFEISDIFELRTNDAMNDYRLRQTKIQDYFSSTKTTTLQLPPAIEIFPSLTFFHKEPFKRFVMEHLQLNHIGYSQYACKVKDYILPIRDIQVCTNIQNIFPDTYSYLLNKSENVVYLLIRKTSDASFSIFARHETQYIELFTFCLNHSATTLNFKFDILDILKMWKDLKEASVSRGAFTTTPAAPPATTTTAPTAPAPAPTTPAPTEISILGLFLWDSDGKYIYCGFSKNQYDSVDSMMDVTNKSQHHVYSLKQFMKKL